MDVLVEAKKEYMSQLCTVLCPLLIETFENLYIEATKQAKGREVLKQYQKLLKLVKDWNNDMVNQHAQKLTNQCAWFNGLVTAVFVSYVKILSSVRLNTENKKISIKLPTTEDFIHRCYKIVAADLYKNPHVFHDEMSESDRDELLVKRFIVAIEATVKEFLPVQEILRTYMTQTAGDNIEMGNENVEDIDTEDPEILSEEVLPEPEPEPVIEPIQEEQVQPGLLDPVQPIAPITSDDVKNIDIGGGSNDVLFPDASD